MKITNLFNVQNKVAIVTGGSRGIGAGIVKRLFNEGAEIIIADIKEDLAAKLMESLDSEKINFVHTDLSKEEEIINLIDFTDHLLAHFCLWVNKQFLIVSYDFLILLQR